MPRAGLVVALPSNWTVALPMPARANSCGGPGQANDSLLVGRSQKAEVSAGVGLHLHPQEWLRPTRSSFSASLGPLQRCCRIQSRVRSIVSMTHPAPLRLRRWRHLGIPHARKRKQCDSCHRKYVWSPDTGSGGRWDNQTLGSHLLTDRGRLGRAALGMAYRAERPAACSRLSSESWAYCHRSGTERHNDDRPCHGVGPAAKGG